MYVTKYQKKILSTDLSLKKKKIVQNKKANKLCHRMAEKKIVLRLEPKKKILPRKKYSY